MYVLCTLVLSYMIVVIRSSEVEKCIICLPINKAGKVQERKCIRSNSYNVLKKTPASAVNQDIRNKGKPSMHDTGPP